MRLIRLDASSSDFRPVVFHAGFNVVLADRTKDSTKKDTRNGLGKTSLLEIIHFCLGGNTTRERLGSPTLHEWFFTLTLAHNERIFAVSRSPKNSSHIVVEGDTSEWSIKPEFIQARSRYEMTSSDWRRVLGTLVFGLSEVESQIPYAPTFRSLFPYFARQNKDAFSLPFETHRKQRAVQTQVNNAFLLGLNWKQASEFQVLKDRSQVLAQMDHTSRARALEGEFGSLGELEAQRVRLQQTVANQEAGLRDFRVLPEYERLEQRANELTRLMHELENAVMSETQLLDYYKSSLTDELTPDPLDVASIYAEAGASLPGMVVERLEDVEEFHRRLVQNRRDFLSSEVSRLETSIQNRRDQMAKADAERGSLMTLLESSHALDEYVSLQSLHAAASAKLNDIGQLIDTVKQLERGSDDVEIEQTQLVQRARLDLDARRVRTDEAIGLFNELSERLYEAPGNLIIDLNRKGFRFDVEIARSGSSGVDSMKVFCYDLVLASLWANHGDGPRVLIHDSTMFAEVDERQVALALALAQQRSADLGLQYLCMLNSDQVPWSDLPERFDIRRHVVLELTDADESGCLFGMRLPSGKSGDGEQRSQRLLPDAEPDQGAT